MNITGWILGIALVILTVIDIKHKEIPLVFVGVLGGVIVIVRILEGTLITELLCGLLPGIVFLAISFLSRGSIGEGDGWVLGVIGLCCGLKATMLMLSTALFTGGIFAAGLLIIKKADRKTTFPFLPFLLLGYLSGVV